MSTPTTPYDSTDDTMRHINRVRVLLEQIISDFRARGLHHDASKLVEPEKSLFDEYTPRLSAVTYGSMEYDAFRSQLKPALDHHYANNSHHPEHYAGGINEMDFLDLLEMLADWKAAGERHDDGDLARSIAHNITRFAIDDITGARLYATARKLGWLK